MNLSLTQVRPSASIMSMTQLPDLLTAAEAAKELRVSDETVHRWARTGRLPFVPMPSGLKRFRREVVDAVKRGEPVSAESAVG
jgi:excisionase family DNA binding protein